MDPRNPHNSYRYKPMDQAAPVYIPPSNATKRIQPVPQREGQGNYHYGMPGQAAPIYVPPSSGKHQPPPRRPGMVATSDEHSKKNIQQLTAKNDALMAALDQASQNQGSNLPPTEYPKLPSHTSFARDPADKVAAQNVGIQATQAVPGPPPPQAAPPMPPMGMQMNPQQQNFARSANPAFNVNNSTPDMSALDEAFKRQSMGG